jgi:DNA-binding phage protein
MMIKPTIHWRTEWINGTPTYVIKLSDASAERRREIERVADEEGVVRDGDRWRPTESAKLHSLFEVVRAIGFDLDFEPEDEDAPLNLQRLKLSSETRERLETLSDFRLDELAGYCPVQAQGNFDENYFYFRARGSYWRFEAGGNESGTKGAKWWYEKPWPSKTGFEAGYMSDEDAIRCILKAVDAYRTEDRSRFDKGHPDFERTTLEGWALGALSLRRAVKRLNVSGPVAVERAKALGIEVPYTADLELKALDNPASTIHGVSRKTHQWVDLSEQEDEDE